MPAGVSCLHRAERPGDPLYGVKLAVQRKEAEDDVLGGTRVAFKCSEGCFFRYSEGVRPIWLLKNPLKLLRLWKPLS